MLELDGSWAWTVGPWLHGVFTLTLVLLYGHSIGARCTPHNFLDSAHSVFLDSLFNSCSDPQTNVYLHYDIESA